MRMFLKYKDFTKINENITKASVEIVDFNTFVRNTSEVADNKNDSNVLSFVDFSKNELMLFNYRFKEHIKGRGLTLNNKKVIEYLTTEFRNEIIFNPTFYLFEIKLKLGSIRITCNSEKQSHWEQAVLNLLLDDGFDISIK